MYYKISSFILNTGKHQNGSRDIYIAQPDAIKENLAGKLFLLAEIDGKKSDTKNIIDFLIRRFEEFYYNDEKIFLQDKIEGLSLDNIFEAALAKLNKALLEFIATEKITLRAEDTNIVLGLVFEDKLLFSSFGQNKSFMIFKRQDQYELINIESSAADLEERVEITGPVEAKFFASVISGEIPPASYFLFCNEALPEYLSNKDLINIVTKLPPMVAAEQIKSALSKVNSYVPFLGIIIKNTFGLSAADMKDDNISDNGQSAHSSISHLNYTEKRTEQMLAPAGLINWRKIVKVWKKMQSKLSDNSRPLTLKTPLIAAQILPPLSGQKTVSAARMIKERMAFGRSRGHIWQNLKAVIPTIINLFNPIFWRGGWRQGRLWFRSLAPRNKLMFSLLAGAALILLVSLSITSVNNRRRLNDEYFNNLVNVVEAKKNMVDSYLLYNNQEGAKTLIGESLASLDSLPAKGEKQIEKLNNLRSEIEKQRAKVQKLTTIDAPELLVDFKGYNNSAETRNLIITQDKAYAADSAAKAVYTFDLVSKKTASFLLSGDFTSLDKPALLGDNIYYLGGNRLLSLAAVTGKNTILNLEGIGADDKIASFQFYDIPGKPLYLLMPDANKIYKLSAGNNSYGAKTSWLKEELSLGDVVDLAVSADIFLLHNNGSLDKFTRGLRQDFRLASVDPVLESASLLKINGDKLFILDKGSKRLLIFDKQGNLVNQFRFPSLNNLKDFSLSANADSAYLLNNDSVYKIVLQ
jgi:hypothetical protein